MARYGRGLICLSLTGKRLDELEIPMAVADNTSRFETAFAVPIDLKDGTTTGISAADRAATVRAAIDPATRPADLSRPGHVFPLRARDGGVLVRAGQTEAAVDLARLAGLYPAGGHLRDHERRRHDGPGAGVEEVRQAARSADGHRRRPHPLPHAPRPARAPRGVGGSADRLRPVRRGRLREPHRRSDARGPRPRGGRRRAGSAGARPFPLPDRRRIRVVPLRLRSPALVGDGAHRRRGAAACCST